jgi:hypothetical protein
MHCVHFLTRNEVVEQCEMAAKLERAKKVRTLSPLQLSRRLLATGTKPTAPGTYFVSQALLRHQARALRLFFRDGMSHLRVDVAFTRCWRACRLFFRCNSRC